MKSGKIGQKNPVKCSLLIKRVETLKHWQYLVLGEVCFGVQGIGTGSTTVAVEGNTWLNSWQYFPSKSSFISDRLYCLPVIGNFFTKIPLPHKPVQNIIAHVGFGPFHAFDIYVPFCHIKVVLHHWSCCWLLPKEFISNLFPESWKQSDTWCHRLQTEQINTEILFADRTRREAQCKEKLQAPH